MFKKFANGGEIKTNMQDSGIAQGVKIDNVISKEHNTKSLIRRGVNLSGVFLGVMRFEIITH